MGILTSRVTGAVILPDGQFAPDGSNILFTLRTWDVSAGAVVLAAPVVAKVTGGQIDATLFQTGAGRNGARYGVVYQSGAMTLDLGNIVIDGAGPYSLADLLPLPVTGRVTRAPSFKRGDTLSWTVQLMDETRRPVNLQGSTVASALAGPDGITRALTLVVTDAVQGVVDVAMTASATKSLPLGVHDWDLRIITGSVVVRTPTAQINIIKEVTP